MVNDMQTRRQFNGLLAAGAASLAHPRTVIAAAANKQTLTYKKVGELEIQADVYNSAPGKRQPTVIWIHCGALIVGHRSGVIQRFHEQLLTEDWTVVSIDYRLAPETKMPDILDDVRDACRWVHEEGSERFGTDPDRIAVAGGSAGGFLTLCTGFLAEQKPKALVSFWGYGDVAGPWLSRPDPFYSSQPEVTAEEARRAVGIRPLTGTEGATGRSRFYLYCRQKGLWPREVTSHDPDRERAAFDAFCPLRNVSKDYPPTLLIHGDKDTDVPYEQSVLMDRELARQGIEHRLITVAGGGHGLSGTEPTVVQQTYQQAADFLRQQFA
ncbi:MAG TPA: alpha/beta hydrolase [Pirellulales bacterium]|jgi:acetyl esterase/lipase|nr:alpha/beta hydrolase [Pirellulales bacterium]